MTPVEIARTYLGTKWAHQGRARHGLDCVGLVVKAFEQYGIRDVTDYGRDPHDGLLERRIAEQFGPPIPKSQMLPGDVVCMAFPRVVRHVGIISDHPYGLGLIHTYSSLKRVTEHALDAQWLDRIRYVHRWGRA
jgi:hypothetical protein